MILENIETIDDLKEMVKNDMKIDTVRVDDEALNQPLLYTKYLNLHESAGRLLRKAITDEKKVYRNRWEYYTGKAPNAEYVKEPLPQTILKSDINIYLDTDRLLVAARDKLTDVQRLVSYLEKVLEQIRTRGFQIKNVIDWRKYLQGN